MKTALFFGSFNPIHTGHLIIANHMVAHTDIDRLWFVVSPQNPLKEKKNLLGEQDRLEMVQLAVEDDPRFDVSDIEFHMPRPSYTTDTLAWLRERHPKDEFALIMGTDNLRTLSKWKNYEQLLEENRLLVYPRPESEQHELLEHPNVQLTPAPLMQISATFIRDCLRTGNSVRYLVPDPVLEYIDKWGLYGA